MKVVILAAGEGSRLRPYTQYTPKCLVKINTKSTLDIQLELFKERDVYTILIGGYLYDQLINKSDILIINSKYSSTNMLYTFFLAAKYFDDDIIVSYGDIAYTKTIFDKIVNSTAPISVAVDTEWEEYWDRRSENPLDDLETMKISGDLILSLGEKPVSKLDINGQYMGLIKFSKDSIKYCIDLYEQCRISGLINGKDFEKAYFTDFLQEIINSNYNITAVFNNDPWIEIDTVDDLMNPITIQRVNKIQLINEKL